MALSPGDFDGTATIEGYGPGFFRVAGQVFRGPVLVEGRQSRNWGGLADHDTLLALAGRVDVLFLGMGADIAHPPAGLVQALAEKGIMTEAMASATAARIYNVTLSEGRRVACALLPL